jgi:hypothetical protein
MDRLMKFFRSFRAAILIAVSMLPWPGLTGSAVAGDIFPVGGDPSLSGGSLGGPAFHALADVNGDGFADLIYTIKATQANVPSTNVYIQYSNGTSFAAPVVVATDSSTSVLISCGSFCHYDAQALIYAVGDVNGDGHPDILFGDGTIALGNGSGFGPKTAWGAGLTTGTWGGVAFHALADINGDGFADLIYTIAATQVNVPSMNVYVQYSSGTGFVAPVVVDTDSSTRVQINCTEFTCHYDAQALVVAVGDINGDKQADILYANGSATIFSFTFVVKPKFYIGSVFYVPPGGGPLSSQGPSSMTYSDTTVIGSTVSTTKSWSVQSTLGVNIGSNPLGFPIGADTTITFGTNFSGSTTTSVDLQNMLNNSKTYKTGIASDSVNHDWDTILIYAGVNVNTTVDGSGGVTWGMDWSHITDQHFGMNGYPLTVGCLLPVSSIPSTECTGTIEQVQQLQLTQDDINNILAADPFAVLSTAPTTIDPCRYVTFYSYSYFPLPVPTPDNKTVTNSVTSKLLETRSHEYSVSFSVDASLNVVDFAKGHLTDTEKFTWTNSSTTSTSTGTIKTSTLALWPPVSLLATLYVYQDTIYKTLMFSTVAPSQPSCIN